MNSTIMRTSLKRILIVIVPVLIIGYGVSLFMLQMPLGRTPLETPLDVRKDVGPRPITTSTAACKPVTNIAFLKVHKAGSSTISNILQRFGTTRKLNFVLPNKGPRADLSNYIGSRGEALSRGIVLPINPNATYNILCNHINYENHSFHNFFPSNTVYISIIREPFSQFISAADYWHYYYFDIKRGNLSKQVSQYLENPSKIKTNPQNCYIKNRQAVDFGFDIGKLNDINYINRYIQGLDKDFHFVMIMEYFDESLILLKKLLCWDLKDILYIKQNTGSYHMRIQEFSRTDRQRHAQLNKADVTLYKYFLQKFRKRMEAEDRDFSQQVSHFKARLKEVSLFCGKTESTSLLIQRSPWNKEFKVQQNDCELLLKPEVPFFNYLLQNHRKKHTAAFHVGLPKLKQKH